MLKKKEKEKAETAERLEYSLRKRQTKKHTEKNLFEKVELLFPLLHGGDTLSKRHL